MNNREIDMLIAEKVFGWNTQEFKNIGVISAYTEDGEITIPDDFSPTEDIKDAWLVFEWIKENVGGIDLITQCTDKPYLMDVWDGEKSIKAEANTAPMAICLAALKSVGISVS